MIDLRGNVVLVTGGTMGIGLATALKYGQAGAQTVITHRWGSADESEVLQRFVDVGAPPPLIVEADAADGDDTQALLERIAAEFDHVDTLVSNVAFALKTASLEDYDKRGLFKSLEYTSWPMVAYTLAIKERFGRYPRYVMGLSSDGPDSFYLNYDFVAMSKSVLETMCRYMNARLYREGTRVNVVRSRLVRTESFDATFGPEFHEHIRQLGFEDCYVTPEEVADVLLALGSGLLDAIGGQVIMADRGFMFFDNLMGAYERSPLNPGKS